MFFFYSFFQPDRSPPPAEALRPSWSPDAQQLAFECYLDGPINEGVSAFRAAGEYEGYGQPTYSDEAADICVIDATGDNLVHLINEPGGDWYPLWSPDGSMIAYLRNDGIYATTPDGYDHRQLLPLDTTLSRLGDIDTTIHLEWSPLGRYLLFSGCIENPDHDVFVLDIETGQLRNLTPASREHDIFPMWTLDGTKVIFLSTHASLYYSGSCDIKDDAPHLLKVVNADGSGEKIIIDKEFYYTSISVSNSGEVAFESDLVSKTADELRISSNDSQLFKVGINDLEPVEIGIPTYNKGWASTPIWSPDEKYLAYQTGGDFDVLDVETEEVTRLPRKENTSINEIYWSPNGHYIAANVRYFNSSYVFMEKLIYVIDTETWTARSLPPR